MRVLSLTAALLAMAGSAQAASREVQYGPAPAWVAPAPAPTDTAPPAGAPVRVIYADNQVRLGADGDEVYSAYRVKILQPQALSLGNLTAAWGPDTDELRVHSLKIIRGDKVIDVLAGTRFQVIQRENNLERAMLDGKLTATLQIPGLQVGDEVEFAVTLKHRDPTLGDHAQGGLALPTPGAPGVFRLRLSWPKGRTVQWRATPDLGELKPVETADGFDLRYELRDPKTAVVAEGAPERFNLRRFVQFSGFSSWAEVSSLMAPLFAQASTLKPDSPVKAEAAKIAASTKDPAARAEAALKLVEDRIRYVYVGLGDGNYRPASADETWTRRFGDCKAKTALLLALLRELGVPAEAVLVNTGGGDGTDERLPVPAAFNHVLVRATVDGRAYWLDGTRLGDETLASLPPPTFRWALPVRPADAKLERVEAEVPTLALRGEVLQIDASKGFDVPAKVSAEQVLRGDMALAMKLELAKLSKEDAERTLKAFWADRLTWAEPAEVAWRYDEGRKLMVMTMSGEGTPEWEGDDKEGRSLDVYGAGFTPPAPYKRPKEQDQAAPWTVDFPVYSRWTTVIRLPPEKDGWTWAYRASQVDERMGGVAYWRDASLQNGVLRTTMSKRVLTPEITAEEAQAVNTRLPKFDNNVSRVWQYKAEGLLKVVDKTGEIEAGVLASKDARKIAGWGYYRFTHEEYDRALKLYETALRIDPGEQKAIVGKAATLESKGDLAGAVRFLDKAVKPDAGAEAVALRASLLVKAGRKDEGYALLDALLAAHADDANAVSWVATRNQELKRTDAALKAVEAGVKISPDDIWFRQTRAALLSGAGRAAEALTDLDAAVRIEPEEPVNYRNRANVLISLGRIDDALADLDEALRMNPLDADTIAAKATALRRAGRTKEALALDDAALKDERTPARLNSACWDRAVANLELPRAEADCAEAVKAAPEKASYWDSYALVALRDGRFDEALRRYDQALGRNPKLAGSLYGRGLTKLKKGDEAGGRADIAAALALTPTAGEALNEAGLKP